jgi:hypothetical protein
LSQVQPRSIFHPHGELNPHVFDVGNFQMRNLGADDFAGHHVLANDDAIEGGDQREEVGGGRPRV